MQVLLVDPQRRLPADLAPRIGGNGWTVHPLDSYRAAAELAQQGRADAVILSSPRSGQHATDGFDALVRVLQAQRTAAILLSDEASATLNDAEESLVELVPWSISADEIRGRLAMIERFQGLVKRMERELATMQRLGKRLNDHFAEVDQDMRLAARLQRDFLPTDVGPFGPASFATLYRPAQWVSGDIYDIIRIDDAHVAFYVADAVGHGMAASLLTMFIKRTVMDCMQRRAGDARFNPSVTMAALNDALAAQALPHCQFVTAVFCVLDLHTLSLRYARAGHPHPLLITGDRTLTELKTEGALLGVFAGEEFPSHEVRLRAGDKIFLYTDGLEVAYPSERFRADPISYHRTVFHGLVGLSAAEAVEKLRTELDAETGSLHPRDDLTVLAGEVQLRSTTT